MEPILTIVLFMICAQLERLGALALRLRFRARYQDRQHRTLVALTFRLPPTVMLELDDSHGDGTQLRLRTSAE